MSYNSSATPYDGGGGSGYMTTPISSLDPRTQVLGSLAEVFGRYSRPDNNNGNYSSNNDDDAEDEENEGYQRGGRNGGDITDAARLEKVWSHARQELREKERELHSLQSRSLAEASMARTGTVLKEALANQLAEERDRARFLELQLAEMVSNHESLKSQYGDCLTKLGESLKVVEEKASMIARMSEGMAHLQTQLQDVMSQRDTAYREREAVITRSIEAMALAERQNAAKSGDVENLERLLEKQRGTIQEGQLKQAQLAAQIASLTAQLDTERARSVEMGETLLKQRTVIEQTEQDRQAHGLLVRQTEQARMDAGRLVRLLADTQEYRMFVAAAFLESGTTTTDAIDINASSGNSGSSGSSFIAAPLPSVVKADAAAAALAASRARDAAGGGGPGVDLARMLREYPVPIAGDTRVPVPLNVSAGVNSVTGGAGRTGLMPMPSKTGKSTASAAGEGGKKPHPLAASLTGPGTAAVAITRPIIGINTKKSIGAPKLGRPPPPAPSPSEQELSRWLPQEVASVAATWRDAVASRLLSAHIQHHQQAQHSISQPASHAPRTVVDASGNVHAFNSMQGSGISAYNLQAFGPSLEEMRGLLLQLNALWSARTHASLMALKAHHHQHVRKLLQKVNFNQPYREVLQASTIARLSGQLKRLQQEKVMGELEDRNAAFLQHRHHSNNQYDGGDDYGAGAGSGGEDDPWALPYTGFEDSQQPVPSAPAGSAGGGFAEVSAPPVSYVSSPAPLRGYHAVPAQGTGITSRATIARERETVGERIHRRNEFVVETPAPTTFSQSHRGSGGIFNPGGVASRGRSHSPASTTGGGGGRRGSHSRGGAASPAPLSSYRLDETGNLVRATEDDAPLVSSLLSVPGSGGQRLDPHETGVLLEEALATVDYLRTRVEALTEERDSLRTALHQTNARRQAVGEMVVNNAAAASAAEQAALASSSFLNGVTREVLHHCSMALSVLESTCSGHLTSALQSADEAVASLTTMASLAVALRYKPEGTGNSDSTDAIAGGDSHERAVRQLLPLIEGIAACLGTVSDNARKCARGHVEVKARLNSALAMPSLAATPGATAGHAPTAVAALSATPYEQQSQQQQAVQPPQGTTVGGGLRSSALSVSQYRTASMHASAASTVPAVPAQPPSVPSHYQPSAGGLAGGSLASASSNNVFNLMRSPSASAAAFLGHTATSTAGQSGPPSPSGPLSVSASSASAAAAIATAERLRQQYSQQQQQQQQGSQPSQHQQRATSPSPLSHSSYGSQQQAPAPQRDSRAGTPPPIQAVVIPSSTSATNTTTNVANDPAAAAVIAQALQVAAAAARRSSLSGSGSGNVPGGGGNTVSFAASPSVTVIDQAAPASSSSSSSSTMTPSSS